MRSHVDRTHEWCVQRSAESGKRCILKEDACELGDEHVSRVCRVEIRPNPEMLGLTFETVGSAGESICWLPLEVLESTRMGASRLRCAGVLLLVVWLTADLAAFGFCSDQFSLTAASTSIGTAHGSSDDTTLPGCRAHHCFCCSSCAEVLKFELAFDANTAFVPSPLQPRPADISTRNTAPPPRF